MKKTLYQVLGVQPEATAAEISSAYEEAMELLAGKAGHDPNQRIILRDAFQILSHPQRRAVYDASQAAPAIGAGALDFDDQQPGLRFAGGPVKWMLGIVALIALAFWWQSRKPAPNPVVIHRASVELVPAPAPASESAPQPAALGSPLRTPEDLYAELSSSVARITVLDSRGMPSAAGSGVVIGTNTIITNCHVTKGGSQLQVKIGKDTHQASVTTADEEFDLCRLDVSGLMGKPVTIGSSAALRTGQKVYAIGAPHGLELTISDGIVSSLREVAGGTLIQTTAPTSPGSSGGGLFDASGRLVGIVTFQHRFGQNLNFAVPVEWIGEMRTRGVGGVIGNLTMGGSERSPAENTPSRRAAAPADSLHGAWQCRDAIGGTGMDLTFHRERRLSGSVDGKPFTGTYSFSGKLLGLYLDSGRYMTVAVEELTANKMIFSTGPSLRTVCNRN